MSGVGDRTAGETEWLTVAEACRYIKISRSTLYNWERAGRLAMYRFGRSVRLRRADLDELAVCRPGGS